MNKICGIYAIIAKDKVYIGASSDIKKRWSYHKSRLRKNKHFSKDIQEAFNEDKSNIEFVILQECKFEELSKYETIWIDKAKKRGFKVLNKAKPCIISKVNDPKKLKHMSEKQRGQLNGNAKLKRADIIEIKKMLADKVSIYKIAEKYKVSPGHIANIKCGIKWKHVAV